MAKHIWLDESPELTPERARLAKTFTTPISTSTQSERPREDVGPDLVERFDALRQVAEERYAVDQAVLDDAMLTGAGFMLVTPEGVKHLPADQVRLEPAAKVTSPELASLAAKYVALSDDDLAYALSDPAAAADVRRLAASVLSQAEPKDSPK